MLTPRLPEPRSRARSAYLLWLSGGWWTVPSIHVTSGADRIYINFTKKICKTGDLVKWPS